MWRKLLSTTLKLYLATWVLVLVFFSIMAFRRGNKINEAWVFFIDVVDSRPFLLAFHTLFLVLGLLYLIFRYFFGVYQRKGLKTASKYAVFGFVAPILLLFASFKFMVFRNTNEGFEYQWDVSIENTAKRSRNLYAIDKKQRGMSVFGWNEHKPSDIDELVLNNIEWVAVIPFMHQKNERTKQMNVPERSGAWSRRDSTLIHCIAQLRTKGIFVQLKPHLWMDEGWRSNINFDSERDWALWFESYRKNMLHYAALAEMAQVELLCIGTELRTSLKEQPGAWITLIDQIRAVYSGKLTYAANWDDPFDQEEFWSKLDYIGVQAYFPLTKISNPELSEISAGWDRHMTDLEALASCYGKQILFTEVGYKSEISATIRPWEWDTFSSSLHNKKSDKTQQLAYEALFQRLWAKEWMAGFYIWQWDHRSTKDNSLQNLDFSPRFKPAQNTIAKWYGRPVDPVVSD